MSPEKMCAGTGISVSSRLSVNSYNHSGRTRKRSSESRLSFLFLFWFLVIGFVSPQFPGARSLLCSVAETSPVDVRDEVVPELEDNTGKTKGTNCGQLWFLTALPLIGISVFFAEFSKR